MFSWYHLPNTPQIVPFHIHLILFAHIFHYWTMFFFPFFLSDLCASYLFFSILLYSCSTMTLLIGLFFKLFIYCVCMSVHDDCGYTCHNSCVKVREQLYKNGCLLLPLHSRDWPWASRKMKTHFCNFVHWFLVDWIVCCFLSPLLVFGGCLFA